MTSLSQSIARVSNPDGLVPVERAACELATDFHAKTGVQLRFPVDWNRYLDHLPPPCRMYGDLIQYHREALNDWKGYDLCHFLVEYTRARDAYIRERVAPILEAYLQRLVALQAPPLPLTRADLIQPCLDVRDFVEDTLQDNTVSVLYGAPGAGKSFFALDLALHVALGWRWFGRETEPGPVVYVSSEGAAGFQNRICAFRQHFDLAGPIPLYQCPASINLKDADGDYRKIIDTIRAVERWHGRPVRMVCIDTLSRALAGGDENSPVDMGLLVRHIEAIRDATAAHVTLLHHCGKDEARGMRGHTILLGAITTELALSYDKQTGVATASVKKNRDLPDTGTFAFTRQSVTLGTNRRGKPVTSCIIQPETPPAASLPSLTPTERSAFDAISEYVSTQGEPVRPLDDMIEVRAIPRSVVRSVLTERGALDPYGSDSALRAQTHRRLHALKTKGYLGFTDQYVWLLD
jgi:hypothetical protein